MPMPDDPGWRGRISRGVIDIVNDILTSEDPLKRLEEYGVKESEAERLLKDLSDERVERIKEGNLDQSKTIRKFFLNNALRKTAVTMSAGETDEPVTCDVKRLIRLPGSIHGKTGFKVEKITLDTLSDFDPLNDTVIFSDDDVDVMLNKPFSISIKNDRFKLEPGLQTLPKYLAVFLIGRKMAFISE
jgi:DNA primase small subunit